MSVKPIDSYNDNRVKNNFRSAVCTGAMAVGLQSLILPKEAKYSMASALKGDKFVKQALEGAVETVSNFDKAGFDNLAAKINIREVGDNARLIVAEGKYLLKALGKMFAGVTIGVLVGNILADAIFGKKINNDKN